MDAKTIQDFSRAHQEFADDMAQNLLNLKSLERELHKKLGSFASDIGPRALRLPSFPTGAFGFQILPEIEMCKTASINLSAHLDTASQAVEAMTQTQSHTISESHSEERYNGGGTRLGNVDEEGTNAVILDTSADVSHCSLREEFDASTCFIDAAPPPPMPSPTQGGYSPHSVEAGDQVESPRETQGLKLQLSHRKVEAPLGGTHTDDKHKPVVVDAQDATAADVADAHGLLSATFYLLSFFSSLVLADDFFSPVHRC